MEVASQWGVSRRTVHRWLARYEAEGLEATDQPKVLTPYQARRLSLR
jgi:transposase